ANGSSFRMRFDATGTVGSGSPALTPKVYADLSGVNATTINALRQAVQLQKFYERDARGGTRYTEVIRAHFNVVSPDGRQQRPEYLGGSSVQISTSSIPQTSATGQDGATTPQGNLAAYAVAVDSKGGFTKSF